MLKIGTRVFCKGDNSWIPTDGALEEGYVTGRVGIVKDANHRHGGRYFILEFPAEARIWGCMENCWACRYDLLNTHYIVVDQDKVEDPEYEQYFV